MYWIGFKANNIKKPLIKLSKFLEVFFFFLFWCCILGNMEKVTNTFSFYENKLYTLFKHHPLRKSHFAATVASCDAH